MHFLDRHKMLLAILMGFCGHAGAQEANPPDGQVVVVDSASELIDSINSAVPIIEVQGTIVFDAPYEAQFNNLPQNIGNALPVLDEGALTIRGRGDAVLMAGAPGFRLVEITNNHRLTLNNLEIRGFKSSSDGGAVRIDNGAAVFVEQVAFINNSSAGHGGAIYGEDDPAIAASHSRFESNRAVKQGGAIYLSGIIGSSELSSNVFAANEASAGCAVTINASDHVRFFNNAFLGPCPHALVRVDSDWAGPFMSSNSFIAHGGKAYTYKVPLERSSTQTRLFSNLFARIGESHKPLCSLPEDEGADFPAVESQGFNIATDASCSLDAGSDFEGLDTDRVVNLSALPEPAGPALDALQPAGIPSFLFPCPIDDVNGLGRPQDADGDGVFGCDVGAVEKQGGADIGPAQTGAYFDPAHNGEGYFVEMLGGGRAWVTFFTYSPIGGSPPKLTSFPKWFFGLGNVVGNSIVIHEFHTAFGPEFGENYNPEELELSSTTRLSLVFPDCQSFNNPGRAFFDGTASLADVPTFTDQLSRVVRLSRIVNCDGEPANTKSGLSGTFYAPERNGEGLMVQWLDEDRVLAMWYTFDLNGQQLWMISGSSQVDGNRVTLEMSYPSTPTAFGRNFDAAEVELSSWGTLTLDYTDCNTIEFSYDSVVEGYGSGQYTYTRLTQPAGTLCKL